MEIDYEFQLEGDDYFTIELTITAINILFAVENFQDSPSKNWIDFLSHKDASSFEINLQSDGNQIKFIKNNLTKLITIVCDDYATITVPISKLEQFIKDLIAGLVNIEKKLGY